MERYQHNFKIGDCLLHKPTKQKCNVTAISPSVRDKITVEFDPGITDTFLAGSINFQEYQLINHQ